MFDSLKTQLTNISNSRMCRIAHVAPQLTLGGMERLLVEFGRHADQSQFQLQFVSLTDRGDVASELEACGWPVTQLGMPPGLHPLKIWQLYKLFQDAAIDVVHTHNNRALIYAAPAARMARVSQLVHTRHGQDFRCSARGKLLVRSMSHLVSHFVSVSQDSARSAIRGGYPGAKVMHILNGIDLAEFPFCGPQPAGPIVMAGRLSPEKNTQALIQAAAVLNRRGIDLTWEIAGDGPCRQSLERLAQELQLGDRVKFLGPLRSVKELLGRAAVFVLPSLTEGVSLAILEAMASGLPVVATRVGGNPEVVEDGQTGILVPPNDAHALAAAVQTISQDVATQKRMGHAARQRVTALFCVRRMVSEYEELYKNARRHPGPV